MTFEQFNTDPVTFVQKSVLANEANYLQKAQSEPGETLLTTPESCKSAKLIFKTATVHH